MPTMSTSTPSPAPTPKSVEFAGEWVGETMGCDMPAHVWEIRAHGANMLEIRTRWEDKTEGEPFNAFWREEVARWDISERYPIVLLDSQHFVIPGWDTNDTRNFVGPSYDVVFSRPGVAELAANRLWERWRATAPPPPASLPSAPAAPAPTAPARRKRRLPSHLRNV